MTVQEWLANAQDYQGFLSESAFEDEAPKFLSDGFYHGELANAMILAISNALEIPVIVYSSALHHPFVYISPRSLKVTYPLHVAFLQYGPGHYNGISKSDTCKNDAMVSPCSSLHTMKCNCGVRNMGDSDEDHCVPLTRKYSTFVRCPCLRAGSGCSEACRCKNCNNPLGKHQQQSSFTKVCRQRHVWQRKVKKSALFSKQFEENVKKGPCTPLE